MELSSKHFLPVGKSEQQSYKQAKMVQAYKVASGDTVWVMEESHATAYTVMETAMVSKQGLWAPYTSYGTIVVNGVVASVHSEWILDGFLELIGRPDLLPLLYQVQHQSSSLRPLTASDIHKSLQIEVVCRLELHS